MGVFMNVDHEVQASVVARVAGAVRNGWTKGLQRTALHVKTAARGNEQGARIGVERQMDALPSSATEILIVPMLP